MTDCKGAYGKEDFVTKFDSNLLKLYDVNFEIGRGAYSTVYQVKQKSTNEIRACKYISKANFTKESLAQFERECKILEQSDHPNIVKVYEIFNTPKSYYIIMENCNGGSLSIKIDERINNKKPFDENILSEIIRQIASAIKYIHDKNICHRDIKPDNICFINMGSMENNTVKLIDFGLSKMMPNNDENKNKINSLVGSPLFVAPEVLNKKYTNKCDIWSLGVILFLIVGGYPPFLNNDQILVGKYEFKEEGFKTASEDVKDLIRRCLEKEEKRISIEEIFEHRWIKKENKIEKAINDLSTEFEYNLKLYQKMHNLEKKIIMFIAMRLNEDEIHKFEKLFIALDIDNSGTLSKEEFLNGIKYLKEVKLTDEEINKLFKKIDTNKNNLIDYTEFISSLIGKDIYLNTGKLKEVFDYLDINKKGKISKTDVKNVLKLGDKCITKYENLLEEIGKGKDDEIIFEEFCKLLAKIISDNMTK